MQAVKTYPQQRYRFRLYDNVDKLSPEQIRAATGCADLCNLGYFALTANGAVKAYDHQSAVMFGGVWGCAPQWHEWGLCIDEDGRMTIGTEREAVYDYAVALPPVDVNGARYTDKDGGRNGWTYTGLTAAGDVVVWINTKDSPMSTGDVEQRLRGAGCTTILRWDGSWSSQGIVDGVSIRASQYRCCRSWLLIYDRQDGQGEEEPATSTQTYVVTPEVGLRIRSGPGTGHARIGAYTKGTVVTILEQSDGWGRTGLGWVSMDYLEPVQAAQTDNGTPIVQDLIPAGRRNRPGGSNPCRYITIHETGNPAHGANARAHASYLKTTGDSVSWHCTVDDSAVYQHLPDTETAWHATDGADGPGNCTSIGVEICVNEGGSFARAKENAASLVRLLMERWQIPVERVVQHHHWYNKNCPQTIRETGTWEQLLSLCRGEEQPAATDLSRAVDKLVQAGVISSPDYWLAGVYATANVQALILKMAAKL